MRPLGHEAPPRKQAHPRAVLFGGGLVGLAGDLPAVVELVKSAGPAVVLPLKFAISFPLVYHTLGGFRHMYWDYTQKARRQRGAGGDV